MNARDASETGTAVTAADSSGPLVSVLIPSHNSAPTLCQALDSVLAQTYPNIEIVVIDDGSTDDTPAVLREYAPRVRSFRQPNGGLASARNSGCALARGEYLALLDADDLCMPERIAVQVEFMRKHPDVVLCSSDFAAFNGQGSVATSYCARYYSSIRQTVGGVAAIYPEHGTLSITPHSGAAVQEMPAYLGDVYEVLTRGNFVHPPTVMFRRGVLESAGVFDESIRNMCDFDWLVRVSRNGKFGFIDRPLLNYRLSDTQLSGVGNRIQVTFDIVRILERVVRDDPGLYARHRAEFRRGIGLARRDAADALAESDLLAACALLGRSVACGVFGRETLKILIKALMPGTMLRWLRQQR